MYHKIKRELFATDCECSVKTEEILKRFTTLLEENFKMNVTVLDRS